MANDVENVFSFECKPELVERVNRKLMTLADEIKRGRFKLKENRTRWETTWEDDWRFISPWWIDEMLQDALTRELGKIDPAIVVTNYYREEFDQFEGVRVTRLVDGSVQSKIKEKTGSK